MAYVYRHIRLDKNIPFYVGIGSDDKGKYTRANTSQCRNKHWHNIVNKVGYEVEIILDEITWEDSLKKEVEFIKLYVRKEHGGILVNLTDGGEGNVGYITSDEAKAKQRMQKLGKPSHLKGVKKPQHVIDAVRRACTGRPSWNKGIPVPEEQKERQRQSLVGKLAGDKHPNFGKKMPDHVKEKLRIANIGKPIWNKGKKGEYKTQPSKLRKGVLKYDMNNVFIQEYKSATEAAIENKCRKAGVSANCTGRIKFHHGYIWKYKA